LWFSSWGNGFELYNAMRRTVDTATPNSYGYNGLPNTLQEPVAPTPRNWPHRLPYPSTEITLNPNASGMANVIWDDASFKLFWDKD
ncbi:MAG: SusD/RagB family nutrient-binding outer membrane lipoprotein, partial [Bacteroidetes bacterium]|nr:SusD/RagB family nutrient-binding outer membrane lipoprotein [Bacteroidota bacterium]